MPELSIGSLKPFSHQILRGCHLSRQQPGLREVK